MEAMVEERRQSGAYRDVFDFARRLDTKVVNKRQLENLIRAGAFDCLDGNRARLHTGVDTIVRYAHTEAAERESGLGNLFGGPDGGSGLSVPNLPARADWDEMERLAQEFGAIGFYLSGNRKRTRLHSRH